MDLQDDLDMLEDQDLMALQDKKVTLLEFLKNFYLVIGALTASSK